MVSENRNEKKKSIKVFTFSFNNYQGYVSQIEKSILKNATNYFIFVKFFSKKNRESLLIFLIKKICNSLKKKLAF